MPELPVVRVSLPRVPLQPVGGVDRGPGSEGAGPLRVHHRHRDRRVRRRPRDVADRTGPHGQRARAEPRGAGVRGRLTQPVAVGPTAQGSAPWPMRIQGPRAGSRPRSPDPRTRARTRHRLHLAGPNGLLPAAGVGLLRQRRVRLARGQRLQPRLVRPPVRGLALVHVGTLTGGVVRAISVGRGAPGSSRHGRGRQSRDRRSSGSHRAARRRARRWAGACRWSTARSHRCSRRVRSSSGVLLVVVGPGQGRPVAAGAGWAAATSTWGSSPVVAAGVSSSGGR